ncbi:hypothetical protein PG997_007473 [Apiospora hydei]|uniref:Uncharacterized protein n=1 Tax=Apiospora hydei TaxID=1337664 RepID=A0ABR1WB11_9PEZI
MARIGTSYSYLDIDPTRRSRLGIYFLWKGIVGDIEVACHFLFTKSKWGPAGCRPKGATVQFTLDDEEGDLWRHFVAGKPQVPVQITEHAPQQLNGETVRVMKTTRNAFVPEINAGGFGVLRGVGRESLRQEFVRSNWRLSSQPLRNHRGWPTTMRWYINENQLERQPHHPNTFYTAFAFEHDGQPFFMQVEVSGHLESTSSNLKHKVKRRFKRFRFPAEPQTATAVVNFCGRDNAYKAPLDELARSIPDQMVMANMKQVPRVPRVQTGPKPLYQISAETEEATIEDETV